MERPQTRNFQGLIELLMDGYGVGASTPSADI